ncbi:MAG: PQQ-binding-like beta-propeller repeat protein [Mariniphaga sp.]
MTFDDKLRLSKNVALLAGVFCAVVAGLLLLNYWQMSGIDPVESKALEALVARLKTEPNNADLMAEIRNFDLLARKAYFTSQWQIKTGAYLLLGGAILLVIALTVYYSLKAKIEEPVKDHENEIAGRILAQKWVVVIGLAIFGFAFVASMSSLNYLDVYRLEASAVQPPAEQVDEQIEVIEVGSVAEEKESAAEEQTVQEPVAVEPAGEEPDAVETQPAAEPETSAASSAAAGLTFDQLKQNHNSFRGPMGQGVVYHTNVPTSWDGASGENVMWKSPIPKHGYNSPVVWGDKVFVAGADAHSREVYCYNRNDGTLLWTGKADNIPGSPSAPPRVTEDTGLSASTVTTDGQRVYAVFGTGDVLALDMAGKRVWARNLGVPDNHYGHSSSLLIWENKLLVQYDTNRGGKILALNSASGETVWETTRDANISWASPVLAEVDGNIQVVLTADPIVAGYDVTSGEELWSVECMMGEVGPSVAYENGVVYAANEYARLVAIDIKTQEILWENDMYLPEAASPLAHEGLLIIATSYGVLVCYDAETGDQYWEHDVGRTLYSSPVYADGKLFMMDNDGVMRIYDFAKEMKLIAENQLGETSGATPAFADGRIYIRGEEHLYCIGK